MVEKLSVVTDSTASLPPQVAKDLNIGVVPAGVIFEGKEPFRDGIDIGLKELMEMLKSSPTLPKTDAPTPGEYFEIYKKCPGGIISVHLGDGYSNVFKNAVLVAKEMGGDRVHPYDSASVSLGVGFMAMRAVELVNQGATIDQIFTELDDMKDRTTVFAALDTLENARKGGRISHLTVLAASTLNIKPILEIRNNKLVDAAKVRTRGKSLDEMVKLTEAFGHGSFERIGVVHAFAPEEDVNRVTDQIKRFHQGPIMIGDIGAVLAVHGGPGIIGVAAVRRK